MRILHVIPRMDPKTGGVCQALRTMIVSLNEFKVFNTVVSLDDPNASFLSSDTFPIIALGPGKGPWSYSSKLSPFLVENYARFDVVIVHGLWLYHAYAVKKSFRIYKRKNSLSNKSYKSLPRLFIMPHGMLDPYFQKAIGRKLKALRNWIYWKLIEKDIVNENDGLLFTCEEERQLAATAFSPYHPKNEFVVGLGVEAPPPYNLAMRKAFLESCSGNSADTYLLFLGRIHNKKGLDLILKAFVKTYSRINNTVAVNIETNTPSGDREHGPTLKLIVAGPGLNSKYGREIQQIIAESDILKEAVIFTDMLIGDAKWGAFYGCEAFILPSHQENFGIAVVEALACAKPVLISNKVNIWREIESGGAGIVRDNTFSGAEDLLKSWENLSKKEKIDMGERAFYTYNNIYSRGQATMRLIKATKMTEHKP